MTLSVLFCGQLCKKKSESPSEMNENMGRSKSGVVSDVSNAGNQLGSDQSPDPEVPKSVDEDVQSPRPVLASDESSIAKNESTSNIRPYNLGKPRGLENKTDTNACYANSVCQLLAACFPQEMERFKGENSNSLGGRLYAIIQYINGGPAPSDHSVLANITDHVQALRTSLSCDGSMCNEGGNASDFLSGLNGKLHFLPRPESLVEYKISYFIGKNIALVPLEENNQSNFDLIKPSWIYSPIFHEHMVHCFKNNGLFCPDWKFIEGASLGDDNLISHFSNLWRDTLSNVANSSPNNQLTLTSVDNIEKEYTKRVSKDTDLPDEGFSGPSLYYFALEHTLPKGTKIVMNNKESMAVPEEHINLPYGRKENPSSQRFELIGYIEFYHDPNDAKITGHYVAYVKRGQQWYRADDNTIRESNLCGDLKNLEESASNHKSRKTPIRQFNAELLVYQAL